MRDHDNCRQMSRCSLRQPAPKIPAAITEMLDTMTLAELIGDDVRRLCSATPRR